MDGCLRVIYMEAARCTYHLAPASMEAALISPGPVSAGVIHISGVTCRAPWAWLLLGHCHLRSMLNVLLFHLGTYLTGASPGC